MSERERARKIWEDVNQFPALEPSDDYVGMTLDHVFGEVWTRPGLTRKERRWITLTAIASAGVQGALEVHIRSALQSGDITRDEMLEFAIHFAHYAGWPLSSLLYTTATRIAGEVESEA